MRGLFNHILGACNHAPNPFKLGNFETVAALAGGLASLGSTAMSVSSAGNLNKDNIDYDRYKYNTTLKWNTQQAGLNRLQQIKLLNREQNWQEEMYNKYNSPSALRNQYESAGYHPYLASPEGGVGQSKMDASSPSPSAPSSPSMSAGSVPAQYMPDFSGLQQAGESFARVLNMNANSANQQSEALKNVSQLIPQLMQIGYGDEEIKKIVAPLISSTQGINSNQSLIFQAAKQEYLEKEANSARAQLELSLARQFSAKERQQKLNESDQLITESVAKIGLMASEANVNDQKVKQMAQDMVESLSRIYKNYAEGSYYDVEGFQLMSLYPYVETELKKAANKAELEEQETFNNSYIRSFDKSVTGKVINALLWYLGRAMSSGNVGVNVSTSHSTHVKK